jgi:hypothetical protein
VLVALATLLAGAAATALSYRSAAEYTGTATYLVPPGELSEGVVVTPFDAERLGRTYAVVIANDAALLEQVAEGVDRGVEQVAERTTTTSLPDSAAIRVQYRGSRAGEVRRYFTALTDVLEDDSPPTDNLVPGTVRLLRVQDEIQRTGGGSWTAGLAGAVAGLLLGLAAAVYLHRSRPTVRQAEDLREARGPFVIDVDWAARGTVEALAHRLLEELPAGADLAVVGATPQAQSQAEPLVDVLASLRTHVAPASAQPAQEARWTTAAFGGEAERAAQRADRTLLLVVEGDSPSEVAARLSDLQDLGVQDVLVAVLHGQPGPVPSSAGYPDARAAGA